MAHIVHEIPYLDTRDINLDWLIRNQRDLDHRQTELENLIGSLTIPKLLIKVEEYGAKGDGQTDDTDAIQNCINENPNATIFFRRGVYVISKTIQCYADFGGQTIMLGGATLEWHGESSSTSVMLSINRRTGDSAYPGSQCRILGGNFDANKWAGYCIEQYGFHTSISYARCVNFQTAGICVGLIGNTARRSLQTKISDCYIRGMTPELTGTAEVTSAIICHSPDNEFSQIVSDGTHIGYNLTCGGNSFINCHHTFSWNNWNLDTATRAQYDATYHIYLDPRTSGDTQINVFQGCYFNVGKYIVYATKNSRMCTTLDSCYYILYSTDKLQWTDGYTVICGGHPSDFRCTNFDVIIGENYYILDYFPSQTPSVLTLPDLIQINSNDRHPEAVVYTAYNRQPEHELSPVISHAHVAAANIYYEIGAIMLCYDGSGTLQQRTQPTKLIVYNDDARAEYLIGFTGTAPNLTPKVFDYTLNIPITNLSVWISDTPEMIDLEGITYPTFKIYLKCASSTSIPHFACIDNNSPFLKCYIRAYITSTWTSDGTGLMQLPSAPTACRKWLLIGDSYSFTYQGNRGWAEILDSILEGRADYSYYYGEGSAGFVHVGANGHTFGDLVHNHLSQGFTDVVICGGVNDRNESYSDIVDAITAVCTEINTVNPRIRTYIAEVGRCKTASTQADIDAVSYPAYRDGAIINADKNVFYLFNMQSVLTLDDLDPNDTVHPSTAGNTKLANYLLQAIGGQTYGKLDDSPGLVQKLDNTRSWNPVTSTDITWNADITSHQGTMRYYQRVFTADLRIVVGTGISSGDTLLTLPVACSGRCYVIIVANDGSYAGAAYIVTSANVILYNALAAGTYHVTFTFLE